MSTINRVILVGRLTKDPVQQSFERTNGRVAKFSLAVNNRKKNTKTNQWEDDPMFIDSEVYNRGEGTLADQVMNRLKKGSLVAVEGRLYLDRWNDKTTQQPRSKHKIIIDSIQFLDPRQPGEASGMSGGSGFSADPYGDAGEGVSMSPGDPDDTPF